MDATQTSRPLVCEQCGTAFTCSGDTACWCGAEPYRLPMPALDAQTDCLCPACLRAAAAAQNNKHGIEKDGG